MDHVAILQANGFDARTAWLSQPSVNLNVKDLVVIPEVIGDGLNHLIPHPVRRVGFVQNVHLIDRWGCHDPINHHPYMVTEDLVAIFTESEFTTNVMRERFPDLPCPLIRTHSSGNGRNGNLGPFRYGRWPREKWIMHFDYKFADNHAKVFQDIELPEGWGFKRLAGLSDEQIAETLRRGAIFVAANVEEGMCAPTSESIISGAVIVCWPGGPTGQKTTGGPCEYVVGRSVLAVQDDIEDLREKIVATALSIEQEGEWWAARTREWSDWFQSTYSRQGEVEEICSIMDELHGR